MRALIAKALQDAGRPGEKIQRNMQRHDARMDAVYKRRRQQEDDRYWDQRVALQQRDDQWLIRRWAQQLGM